MTNKKQHVLQVLIQNKMKLKLNTVKHNVVIFSATFDNKKLMPKEVKFLTFEKKKLITLKNISFIFSFNII